MRALFRTTLDATTFAGSSLLVVSPFLHWINRSIEFGGGVSAFQEGTLLVRIAVLAVFLVALARVALIAVRHFDGHHADGGLVVVLDLLMAAIVLVLALIIYVALSPTKFTYRGPGAYLAIVSAAMALLAAVTLRAAEAAATMKGGIEYTL